mmetsp:Transcript_13028/g.17937  ORF Transcript_13028/g.17937 Transcript_13028/m.17937 type:complete len:341 (-) Transcript_13028:99-1121(-)
MDKSNKSQIAKEKKNKLWRSPKIVDKTSETNPVKKEEKTKKRRSVKGKREEDDEVAAKDMVSLLNDDEKEIAARSSYEYFVAATSNNVPRPSDLDRETAAKAMARRHFIAEKRDKVKASKKMKNTIQHRVEINIDAIRKCYDPDHTHLGDLRSVFDEEMATGKMVVRGYDNNSRALFNYFPRLKNSEHEVNFVKMHYYMIERAIACTERASAGAEEKVVVLVDYSGYKGKSHDPPLKLAKEMLFSLRDHYPERLHRVYLVDAPILFRAFWAIVKPFIDPDTKKKFRFVTGNEQKRKEFADSISVDQAMPFVLPEGEMTSPINVKTFLYSTPFNKAYDEND